jgi:predicted RNase H-like nuclease (RuvC/YqgF family)
MKDMQYTAAPQMAAALVRQMALLDAVQDATLVKVARLEEKLSGAVSQADFDRRLAALGAAKAHVKEMLDEKNGRGYNDYKVPSEKRVELELRVARYLLDDEG